MILNVASSAFKSVLPASRYCFGASAHKVTNVIETKNNPTKAK